MPIKGLQTEQEGLPRAGIIRLGFKIDTGKKDKYGNPLMRPAEADHFVLTDAPGVAEALGTEKPTELRVYFPFDDINLVFPAYMQNFVASALTCRGDGEHIIYAIDSTTGKATVRDGIALVEFGENDFNNKRITHKPGDTMFCPGTSRDMYAKCAKCKPNAMLLVLLRDVPRMAYYQIATTSIHNIIGLTKQLNTVRKVVGNITGTPRLTGVPFVLKRVKRSISAPKQDGGRQRVDKWFLQLEIDPDWVLSMFTAQRRLADPLRLTLPMPETATPQDAPPSRDYAEPPQWEAYEEVTDGEFEEAQPSPEPETTNGNILNGIEDLLFQLHLDFGLKEDEAKARIKELGYNGLPKDESQRRQKLSEIYAAVKSDIESKAGQLGLGLDVPAPAVKSAVQAGL